MEIELADAVASVRDELMTAAARGADSDVAFVVGPIELEFAVEMRRSAKAKAGFKAWLVSADVEGEVARGRTHKVKLTLTPKKPGGGDLLVAGDQARPMGPGEVSGHIEH
ncbi:trypco2 family protein [Amycolatopsis kentuckyensis]|uniref:trypco2 family protein n=1 Tax=Amycolatopsis kentuckyensis TaxID=218823 RepID=UPI000A3928F3|nr:trypco2 family protein [Amycolatopsis kentuckyensis]